MKCWGKTQFCLNSENCTSQQCLSTWEVMQKSIFALGKLLHWSLAQKGAWEKKILVHDVSRIFYVWWCTFRRKCPLGLPARASTQAALLTRLQFILLHVVRYKSKSAEEIVQLSVYISPSSVTPFICFCSFVSCGEVFCAEIRSSSVRQETEKQRFPPSLSTLP